MSRLLQKQLSKRLLRVLWLIPLLTAILPLTLSPIESNPVKTAAPYTDMSAASPQANQEQPVEAAEPNLPAAAKTAADAAANPMNRAIEGLKQRTSNRSVSLDYFRQILSVLYLIGILVLSSYSIYRSVRFRKRLNRIAKIDLLPQFEDLKKAIGIKREIQIYSIDAHLSP